MSKSGSVGDKQVVLQPVVAQESSTVQEPEKIKAARDRFDHKKGHSAERHGPPNIGQRILKGLGKIADPFIVTTLINGGGTLFCHFVFGLPIDPKIVATFQVFGMTVGGTYGPAKAALKAKFSRSED